MESVGGIRQNVKTGKLYLEGRKEPGGGRRLEGQDEPVMRGWGTEGRSRQNVGSLVEGLPGTLRGAKGSSSLEPDGAGIVWNCGRGV